MVNVTENLLWRDFKAKAPNEKWTTDITYVWVNDQWLYLAAVMDLYSRRIVAWASGASMTEELVRTALNAALAIRRTSPWLTLHSDRGVQYRAQKYIDYAVSRGIKLSMSRKGNCWENAPMGSFFSRLKVELIYAKNYQTMEEARSGIFGYIEVLYNRRRRHSANDNLSLVQKGDPPALLGRQAKFDSSRSLIVTPKCEPPSTTQGSN
ncbi:IS3 family transposase, partial [Parahaliea mediterranea]